jgi:predicted DCC family thiol-disulfide oxidoreductase YuxK
MTRPVVLYDGECRFCRFTVRVAARFSFGRLAFLPFDDPVAVELLARLPEAIRFESAHVFRPDGSVWSPTSAPYRFVARNRSRLGPLVPNGPGPRRYP